jgi:hypothetical protein
MIGRILCRLFGHHYRNHFYTFIDQCERCDHWRIALRWQRIAALEGE